MMDIASFTFEDLAGLPELLDRIKELATQEEESGLESAQLDAIQGSLEAQGLTYFQQDGEWCLRALRCDNCARRFTRAQLTETLDQWLLCAECSS